MKREYDLSNQRYKAMKTMKISRARIEHTNYKFICKEKYEFQTRNKENCNDHMGI
jgi:hypothetical protein